MTECALYSWYKSRVEIWNCTVNPSATGASTVEVEQEIDSKEIGTTPSENEGQPHNIKHTTSTSTTTTTDDRWNGEEDAEFIATFNSTVLAQIKVCSKLGSCGITGSSGESGTVLQQISCSSYFCSG